MAEPLDDDKEKRVRSWLESLSTCAARLADVRAALEMLGYDDGIKAVRTDYEKVSGAIAKADKVGGMVAEHEEQVSALLSEADVLSQAVVNAVRVIHDAWNAHVGECDKSFQYILLRYVKLMRAVDAARAAGLTRYGRNMAVSKVSAFIVDAAPELFDGPVDDVTRFYGYELGTGAPTRVTDGIK